MFRPWADASLQANRGTGRPRTGPTAGGKPVSPGPGQPVQRPPLRFGRPGGRPEPSRPVLTHPEPRLCRRYQMLGAPAARHYQPGGQIGACQPGRGQPDRAAVAGLPRFEVPVLFETRNPASQSSSKTRHKHLIYLLEATPGIEPGYADLQSAASPLRHVALLEIGRWSSKCRVFPTCPLYRSLPPGATV